MSYSVVLIFSIIGKKEGREGWTDWTDERGEGWIEGRKGRKERGKEGGRESESVGMCQSKF